MTAAAPSVAQPARVLPAQRLIAPGALEAVLDRFLGFGHRALRQRLPVRFARDALIGHHLEHLALGVALGRVARRLAGDHRLDVVEDHLVVDVVGVRVLEELPVVVLGRRLVDDVDVVRIDVQRLAPRRVAAGAIVEAAQERRQPQHPVAAGRVDRHALGELRPSEDLGVEHRGRDVRRREDDLPEMQGAFLLTPPVEDAADGAHHAHQLLRAHGVGDDVERVDVVVAQDGGEERLQGTFRLLGVIDILQVAQRLR